MNSQAPISLLQIAELFQRNDLQSAERAISQLLSSPNDNHQADAWHLGAAIALKLQQFKIALRRIGKAMEIQRGNAEFLNTRGAILLELKKYQEAFESFARAGELKPEYLEASRNCGLTLMKAEQWNQAESSFTNTLKQFPKDAQSWSLLAETRLLKGRYQGATEAAKRALQLNASLPHAHEILIKSLLAGGYHAGAEDALQIAESTFSSDPRFEELRAIYLARTGSSEKAIPYFQRRVQQKPNSLLANITLATAYLKSKRLEEFNSIFTKTLSLPMDESGQFLTLGEELLNESMFEEAGQIYGHILKAEPHNQKARVGQAKICSETEREEEGITILDRLSLDDSPNLEALLLRAKLAIQKNDFETAIRHLRRFVAADPNHTEACLILAEGLLKVAGAAGAVTGTGNARHLRLEEALILTHRALDDPNTDQVAKILLVQGRILHSLHRHDEAVVSLKHALEIDPDIAEVHFALGFCYVELGFFDLAEEKFLRAIECNPNYAKAHYQLAISIKTDNPKQRLSDVDRVLKESNPSKRDEVLLHFAKARHHDALKDYDAAFEEYGSANELKPTPLNDEPLSVNNPANHSLMMNELVKLFSKEFFEGRADFGSDSERPIFIVGMPRSGTTLTEQILSSHSEIHGAGELNEINDLRPLVERLCTERPARYPHAVKELSREDILFLVKRHDRLLNFHDSKSRYVSDKMPTNFLHLGLIGLMLPKARIVHCCRDPRDIAVSSMRQNLDWPFCDLEQIGLYMNSYQKLMAHWKATIPNPIHTVVYEDLVTNPNEEIPKLIEFCNLEWEDACLNFHDSNRTVITPSKTQVRQPMYTSSIGSWKRYEKHLGPLLENLEGMDAN